MVVTRSGAKSSQARSNVVHGNNAKSGVSQRTRHHIARRRRLIGSFATYKGTHLAPLRFVQADRRAETFDFAGKLRVVENEKKR